MRVCRNAVVFCHSSSLLTIHPSFILFICNGSGVETKVSRRIPTPKRQLLLVGRLL